MLGCIDIKKEEEDDIIVKNEPISDGESEEVNHESISEEVLNTEAVKEAIRVCAYCNLRVARRNTVNVPKNTYRRQIWAETLGPQYRNYIASFGKRPVICQKHFYPEDLEVSNGVIVVNSTAVPHTDEISGRDQAQNGPSQDQSSKKIRFATCAYCNERKLRTEMRIVPMDPEVRNIWGKKLGTEFRKNLNKSVHSYICKSHFSGKDFSENGRLLRCALPMTEEEASLGPDIPESDKSSICGEEIIEEPDDQLNMDCDSDSHIPGNLSIRTQKSVVERCGYCSATVPLVEMIRASTQTNFGQNGAKVVFEKLSSPYVCISHFGIIEEVTKAENDFRMTCAYCNRMDMEHVRKAHVHLRKLKQWKGILGREFEKNCRRYTRPVICWIHFLNDDIAFDGRIKKYIPPGSSSNLPCESVNIDEAIQLPIEDYMNKTEWKDEEIIIGAEVELCDENIKWEIVDSSFKTMYKYGWANKMAMSHHQRKCMFWNNRKLEKAKFDDKCLYCSIRFSVDLEFYWLKVDEWLMWENCSKMFGRQYRTRLTGIYSSYPRYSLSAPSVLLCSRHFDHLQDPISDKFCLYSVDELTEHTYADFSESKYWNPRRYNM